MSKPRDTFIGNLKVLETKKIHAGRPLEDGRILVKLRGPRGSPFWCEMSSRDYESAIEKEGDGAVELQAEVQLRKKA